MKGNIYVMNDVFSCYRIHEKGLWQGSSQVKQRLETTISIYYFMNHLGKEHKEALEEDFKKRFIDLQKYLLKNDFLLPVLNLDKKEQFLYLGLINDIKEKYGNDYIQFDWKECIKRYKLLKRLHLDGVLLG